MPVSPVLTPSNERLVSIAKIDGEVISDLQALEYKIVNNQQNVHNIGIDERIGVDYGPMLVTGSLKVRYSHPKLDTMLLTGLANPKNFQLVIELKKLGQTIKTHSFDDCLLTGKSFSMDANGVGISDYSFTATRVREQ